MAALVDSPARREAETDIGQLTQFRGGFSIVRSRENLSFAYASTTGPLPSTEPTFRWKF